MTVASVHEGFSGDWTGFALVIVPVAGLAVDADELFREVQEQVERDAVLQDTVRVGISADVSYGGGASPVVEALSRTALNRGGTMFAPSAVFGCAVVGNDIDEANRVARELAQSPILRRLNVLFYGVAAQPDAMTVAAVVAVAVTLMESYEADSSRAIGAEQFTQVMARPPKPVTAPRAIAANPQAGPISPQEHPAAYPAAYPDSYLADYSPPSAGDQVRRGPRLFARARNLSLPARTAKPSEPTQSEALDRLAKAAEAVTLVYLVLPLDSGRISRDGHRRRTELVVELDRALASAAAIGPQLAPDDTRSPTLTSIETAVLVAGRHLNRTGSITTAGKLALGRIPKLSTGFFDLVTCIDDLTGIYARDSASLRRRAVALAGTHVIFVSTGAPLADAVSVAHLEHLSQLMQIRWILLGDAYDLMSGEYTAAGVRSFQDHPDVANELVTAAFSVSPDL